MSQQQQDETKHPSFTETKKQNAMLVVRTATGDRFQLPYHHLLGAHYQPKSDTGEIYILEFAFHILRIVGANLLPMVSAIDEMKVRLVKPAAEDTPQTHVRISRIDVAYRHEGD